MKLFFSLALIGLFTSFSAQEVTYPYNPDANNDQYVAVSDVLSTVSAFGSEFLPTEIQIDGVGLAEVIGQLIDNQNLLQATVDAQQAYISELQQYISINDETVLISGANLQVVSGGGSTDAAVNGTGNIIIGYDEESDWNNSDKSGSHNLVVGYGHTYSSYGGIVVGNHNSITGNFSSVSGGYLNTASGIFSSVTGGGVNTASGNFSSVSGGNGNTNSGNYSSVLGDAGNTFLDNSADGNTIEGGGIEGLDTYLSVDEATNTVLISGANLQVVSGEGSTYSTVNGTGNIIIGYDENYEDDKSGSHNLVVGRDHTYSSYAGIVVGYNNSITGPYSSVSGGYNNTASGDVSSVSGGISNTASGMNYSVSGDAGKTFLDNSADGNTID